MRAYGFDRKTFKKMARTAGVTAFAAAAAIMMTPSPAQARSFLPSPRDVHNRVVHDVRRVLEVPRAIHAAHVDAFRSFYRGNTYYAPHHHYHAVYRYPTYVGAHVYYRPYYYCNNALFVAPGYGYGYGYPAARIVVNIGPGGYYYYPPAPLPPPPPAYYPRPYGYPHDDRYDHRHDDRRDDDRYDHRYDNDDHQGDEDYDH